QDAKILVAGTRRTIEVQDASGLKQKSVIIFVPTGKRYTLNDDPNQSVFSFDPAIPVGRDWESKTIQKDGPTTQIKTTLTAPGDTVEVKNVTQLNAGDEIFLNDKKHTIVTVTPGVAPEGSIKVAPPFGASNLPKANDEVVKHVKEVTTEVKTTLTAAGPTV